jgi:4-hydroxy-4-methyl-2-oxoglutarate aldolase
MNDLWQRLSGLDAASLADAGLRVLPPEIRPIAPGVRLVGRVITVDAGEDLMPVLGGLLRGGPGDVLMVATDGARLAVAGELFATEALRRGMAGIIIDGYCRDLATLLRLPLPVFARGATPRAAPARAVPVVGVPVRIGGVEVRPGELVLGDDDGVVVGDEAEFRAAAEVAGAIQIREERLRSSIQDGASLFDHVNFAEHAERLSRGEESALRFS